MCLCEHAFGAEFVGVARCGVRWGGFGRCCDFFSKGVLIWCEQGTHRSGATALASLWGAAEVRRQGKALHNSDGLDIPLEDAGRELMDRLQTLCVCVQYSTVQYSTQGKVWEGSWGAPRPHANCCA